MTICEEFVAGGVERMGRQLGSSTIGNLLRLVGQQPN
jgi:hypothetical protein